MITFYGKHYIAYFYSEHYDCWMQFNDEHLTHVGNYKEVMRKCINGKQQPITIFYENEDIIKDVISNSGASPNPDAKEQKLYFSEKQIRKNNFWIYHGKTPSDCNMF